MMIRSRGVGSTTFATSTSPKMKAYAPAPADHSGYDYQDPKPK